MNQGVGCDTAAEGSINQGVVCDTAAEGSINQGVGCDTAAIFGLPSTEKGN